METSQNNYLSNHQYNLGKSLKKQPGYEFPLLLWGLSFVFVSLSQYMVLVPDISMPLKSLLNISGLFVGLSAIVVTIHFVVNRKPKSGREKFFKYYWLVVFVLYHVLPFFILNYSIDYHVVNVLRLIYVGIALIVWGIINNFVLLIYGGALFAVSPLFVNLIHQPYQYLAIAFLWLAAYITPFSIQLLQKKSVVFERPKLGAAIS